MGAYEALLEDASGASAKMSFSAASDSDAQAIANEFAGKSDASWSGLQALTDLTVDPATYTNFADAAKPAAGSTVRKQGKLHYAVQSPQQELIVTIPAVLAATLSPTLKSVATDPANGLTRLVDEEGVAVTGFNKGVYKYVSRKGK